MIEFEPTEDQRLMQESIAQFAKSTLAPRIREFERLRALPDDVLRTGHEIGLSLLALPEACGGQGQGLVTSVLIEEELGSADAASAFALSGPGALATAVLELGTEEQARAYLEDFSNADDGHTRFGAVAWSELAPNKQREGFTTTANKDGDAYVLTGKKAFVTNGLLASRFVVFAQVDETKGWAGIGAFVVEKDNPGLKLGKRHDTLGLDAASFGEITLEGARVTEGARLYGGSPEGDITRATLRFFAKRSLIVAARALGVARFAFDIAREYCDTRTAFGKPIGHFQAVAFTLADRLMDVESARWLVWKAARAWDSGGREKDALKATAQAAAHALEVAMRTADDCVSLHGGSGFIRDLIAEKLMRDAKQIALACPTTEQQDQLAAALDLHAKLDPALVLPTPDTQAIFT
jgi:alkylation response protein AidB-like acyl-CoA dehydrogenase